LKSEIHDSWPQGGEQVLQLLVNLLGADHRLGDFLPDQVAVSLAQAVDGDFDRAFGHVEARGHLGLGDDRFFTR
jgi:hypothetical protein